VHYPTIPLINGWIHAGHFTPGTRGADRLSGCRLPVRAPARLTRNVSEAVAIATLSLTKR